MAVFHPLSLLLQLGLELQEIDTATTRLGRLQQWCQRSFGVDAPGLMWLAAALLLLLTLGCLASLLWRVRQISLLLARVTVSVREVAQKARPRHGHGLSTEIADRADRLFADIPSLQHPWQLYQSQRVLRRDSAGALETWVAQPADISFTDELVIDGSINRSFYTAIPGIVTGAGLLFTFIAILLALVHVKMRGDEVEGLQQLIEGLSGKFVTSIAALAAATLYLLCERPLLHQLTRKRSQLVAAVNTLFPVLTPAQILVELAGDTREQSTAFKSFNADLSQKLRQSFSESMGPTLIKMVSTVDELNQLLRAAEANKQESITGSLGTLLQKLETSIIGSLRDMGKSFTASISGGAQVEFASVIDSLRSSAKVLEQMNTQFLATQQAIAELTQRSNSAAAEQIQIGRSQIEDLTEVLRSLMTQINESAGASITSMAGTLTSVVHDLSSKVTELSERMTNSVIDSAGLASTAAVEVIEKAHKWSDKSAEQLAELIRAHRGELDTVKSLRSELESSLSGFRTALRDYAAVNTGLKDLVANANASAASLGGIAKSLRDTQGSVERVSDLSATHVTQLGVANRAQEETWRQIQHNMTTYQDLFAQVEAHAGVLLGEINDHLNNYVNVSKDGFKILVEASDEHFANAAKRLSGTVSQLDETLQDLVEEVGRVKIHPPRAAS